MDAILGMLLGTTVVTGCFSLSARENVVQFGKRLGFTLAFNTVLYFILRAMGVF